jgi:hypothetical protein
MTGDGMNTLHIDVARARLPATYEQAQVTLASCALKACSG